MQNKNEKTVAQMAAFFLFKAKNRKLPHLKLMKLLYLADRAMIKKYGYPLSFDYPVSMQHGPVLSQTLNLMDGDIESCDGGWTTWVSDKKNYEVSLKKAKHQPEETFIKMLDHISSAALDILKSTWEQFGSMDKWQIRDWTHENCREWKDTLSSAPIQFEDIAQALDFEKTVAEEIARRIRLAQHLDRPQV